MMTDNLEEKVREYLESKSPNGVAWDNLYLEFEPAGYSKREIDEGVQKLITTKVITDGQIKSNQDEIFSSGMHKRKTLALVDYSGHKNITKEIKIGPIKVPRLLVGDQQRPEDINFMLEKLAEYVKFIEDKGQKQVEENSKKFYSQIITLFGIFISIFSVLVISIDKMLRFDPKVLTTLSFADLVLQSIAVMLPAFLVILVFCVIIFFLKK